MEGTSVVRRAPRVFAKGGDSMGTNLLRAIAIFAITASGQVSAAATYNYSFGTEFSGGTPPVLASPWATLSFSDVSLGAVSMALNLSGLAANENIKNFYFNFGGAEALIFSPTGGQAASKIATGSNAFKADGDGYYDVKFSFPTSGNLFGGGESSSYTITGTGLTAAAFDAQSLCGQGCGNGGWYSALHVQNTGPDKKGSGWIGATVSPVAEPENYVLMLAGLGLVGFIARRRMMR